MSKAIEVREKPATDGTSGAPVAGAAAGVGASERFPRRGLWGTLSLYAKGLAVGASDLVPGFSGGTMALVLGIYREILAAIGSLSDRRFIGALFSGRFKEAYARSHGAFILTLGAGMLSAIVILAPVASHLVGSYPTHVAAFFFGLVAASAVVAGGLVKRWRGLEFLFLAAGAAGAFVIVGLTPTTTPSGALFLILSGAVAVCALALPGLSGSFMLVLLGKYDVALAAVAARDLTIIAPLILGGIIGLVSFARVLTHLLRRHHDPMMALLVGFVIGSLRKVWPFLQADGVSAAWPWSAAGPNAWLLLLLMGLGLLAVLALDRLSRRRPGARGSA